MDLQAALDGRPYWLTIAAPAIEEFYSTIELGEIHFYLDWINLMAYGYSGSWSELTNHDSRLFPSPDDPDMDLGRNTDTAVRVYLEAGVPGEKIVLGVPFYGRGWAGVPADEKHGLYQSFDSLPDGTLGVGFYDYADLASDRFASYTRYWDDAGKAAWLYDPLAGVTISYEDPQSLRAKADYVRENNLGGMMIWELANDDAKHTLLTTVYFGLNP
jgi:chitinase